MKVEVFTYEMDETYKTAKKRRAVSSPTQYLRHNNKFVGSPVEILDYGCGKGYDCDVLGHTCYDKHYRPARPLGKYKTIYCNYVLNVISEPSARLVVLKDIQQYLTDDGIAYISVRNDKSNLNGWTTRGTWQGFIELDLTIEKKCAKFRMYRMTKGDLL